VDLGADGRQVTVSLTRQSLAAKQRVRIVPRRDATPLVTADPLSPRACALRRCPALPDGSFIGSTYWNTQAKRAAGAAVRARRPHPGHGEPLEEPQRLGRHHRAARERQIIDQYSITSRHKAPIELLVLEAAPVAVADKITVEAAFRAEAEDLELGRAPRRRRLGAAARARPDAQVRRRLHHQLSEGRGGGRAALVSRASRPLAERLLGELPRTIHS